MLSVVGALAYLTDWLWAHHASTALLMSGVGAELSRISRLSHDSVFDAWLIQLRAVLGLRDLDQFIDIAPARNQSDQVEGDKRALAIVTL
jgi:hypothetical protein